MVEELPPAARLQVLQGRQVVGNWSVIGDSWLGSGALGRGVRLGGIVLLSRAITKNFTENGYAFIGHRTNRWGSWEDPTYIYRTR